MSAEGRGRKGCRGKGRGRAGKGYAHAQSWVSETINFNNAGKHDSGKQVEPTKAKALLWSWLQRSQKVRRPAERVSVEYYRERKGHVCTAWVWMDGDWQGFQAAGSHPSRNEAMVAAYVKAVEGLHIPVPPEYALTEDKRQKITAEERKRAYAAQQRANALEGACKELEAQVLTSLFASPDDDSDRFFTPRESKDEPMPVPIPPRIHLPTPVEAKGGEERGNKAMQQIKQVLKREKDQLQGPTMIECQRPAPGGTVHVCAYAVLYDRTVLIAGTAWGTKRNSVRAAAATALLPRLDTSATLPANSEAGPYVAEVIEIKKLQQLQNMKVWSFEGIKPGESPCWYGVISGQVPLNGWLRDFCGRGVGDSRALALGSACRSTSGALTRMTGETDCISWLKKMARVGMDVDEVPRSACQAIMDEDGDGHFANYDEKLNQWLAERRIGAALAEPPDFDVGAAPTAPQIYEPELDDSPQQKSREARGVPRLPVRELRSMLAEELGDNSCMVVSGGTGSGKSTQIPQYLIDDFRPDVADVTEAQGDEIGEDEELPVWRGPARVIVTQPRRIAAISLAERVAWERGEPVGRGVGYSVRGDTKPPKDKGGTIEYCTVGILLRRLQRDPHLRQVSHVLVDEVHERDLMTDFLLILLKELLCLRSDLRVVLMSATLDVRTFSNYLWNCPCLEIATGPRYEVEEIHLEDALFAEPWAAKFVAPLLTREEEARRIAEETREEAEDDGEGDADEARTSMNTWWGSAENDETYMDLMARLIMHLAQGPALLDDEDLPGSVLCFLPGWAEIKAVQDRLREEDPRNEKLWLLPLHSTLPKEEQQLIFQRPQAGKTKVILATNIAESSVTIDDVLVVVDAGLAREVSYDPVRHLSTLETVWVSQSSAIQRMGRAGRVRKGRCFRLYSRAQLEQAPWRSPPEMQRCELSSTCLQALALKREVRDFLSRAPDPPMKAAVETAMEELLQVGAVCPAAETGATEGTYEQMLPLGDALSRMTISPKIGRMMILGTLFGAADDACLLAAVIAATRRVFACPPGKKRESLACIRGFSSTSDTLAAFVACKDYEAWRYARSEAYADRWAGELFLVAKRVKQLLHARDMHIEELQRAGLLPRHRGQENLWTSARPIQTGMGADEVVETQEAWDEGTDLDTTADTTTSGTTQDVLSSALQEDVGDPIELVKALLVAAYPQNLALRRKVSSARHNTPTGLEAIVAPQSVNAQPKQKASASDFGARQPSWWSYGNLHISNKQGFLRTTTLIDTFHVALFGGLTVAVDESSGVLREVDGWIELKGPRTTLRVFGRLREVLSRAVQWRTLEPAAPLPEALRAVLREVVELLRTATARQEALRAALPDAPSQIVDKPPPLPPPSKRRQWCSQRSQASVSRTRNGKGASSDPDASSWWDGGGGKWSGDWSNGWSEGNWSSRRGKGGASRISAAASSGAAWDEAPCLPSAPGGKGGKVADQSAVRSEYDGAAFENGSRNWDQSSAGWRQQYAEWSHEDCWSASWG